MAVANGLLARRGVAAPPPKPDKAEVLFMRMSAAGPIVGKLLPVWGIEIFSSKKAVLSFIECRIVRAATRFFDVLTYVP